MTSIPSLTPVFLLTGFLGAGKTTLLEYILEHQTKHKIAIIENEIGNTHFDSETLHQKPYVHITTLKNGCICCSSNVDLHQTLIHLLEQRRQDHIIFDLLIIECTGMADPGPIIRDFLKHPVFSTKYSLRGVITLVDIVNALYQFQHFNVTQAQIGFADIILVSKTDLLEFNNHDFFNKLACMNNRARILSIVKGKIDLTLLDDLNGFSLPTKPNLYCQDISTSFFDTQVSSFVIIESSPFELDLVTALFEKILRVFDKQLLRFKACLQIKNSNFPLLLQGVQQLYDCEWGEEWTNSDNKKSELIFIGITLPENEIRSAFKEIQLLSEHKNDS